MKTMLAVIIATGIGPGMEALNERYPTPLLPLVDRPFIQHVVEYLVDAGVTRFEFVLSHLPEKIEDFLGDGSRWGSHFGYHLTRDPSRPYDLLRIGQFEEHTGPVILAHADRLPQVDLSQYPEGQLPEEPVMFYVPPIKRNDPSEAESGDTPEWSGWALLNSDVLSGLPKDMDETSLRSHLESKVPEGHETAVTSPFSLSVRSYHDLLASQEAVLDKKFQGLLLGGKEASDSIWLSRNVTLHPSATLDPPVYIGENCRIGKGLSLGPYAVIGRDCVLDSGCTVGHSHIFPGSYVGEGLELKDVIVDRNRLINVRFGSAISISDSFILGGLSRAKIGQWFSGLLSRCVAVILLILLSPFLLCTVLALSVGRRGPVLYKKEAVRLPAQSDETMWRTFECLSFFPENREGDRVEGSRHFFLKFLPGLINIVKGDFRFVGVSPRTPDEIKTLNQDWRALYLKSKAGVITEAFVNYGGSPTSDELYSTEVLYSVTAGLKNDLKLICGYIERLLGGFFNKGKEDSNP